ncbi:MAG: hypothetical protein Q4E24_16685, partial [bacterium]|nr:hypothetical protein [bacterium]
IKKRSQEMITLIAVLQQEINQATIREPVQVHHPVQDLPLQRKIQDLLAVSETVSVREDGYRMRKDGGISLRMAHIQKIAGNT